MASSVRLTAGGSLSSATRQTITGDWTEHVWVHPNSGEYGDAGSDHVIYGWGITGGTSEGYGVAVLGADDTSITVFVFRNGGAGADFQTVVIKTGSFIGWIAVACRHTAGSPNYDISYRLENATTWTTVTLALSTQVISAGSVFLGTDQFGEPCTDSDVRGHFCQAVRMSDATLLAASQASVTAAPAGTNLHYLRLLDAASGATNGGTAGNWTVGGTLQTAASEPAEALPVVSGAARAQPTVPVRGIANRKLPPFWPPGSVGSFVNAAAVIPPVVTLPQGQTAPPTVPGVFNRNLPPFWPPSNLGSFSSQSTPTGTIAPSGVRAGAVVGAFSILVTSGATGIAQHSPNGAATEITIAQPASAAKAARSGAPSESATSSPSGVRSAGASGVAALIPVAQPAGARTAAASGAASDTTSISPSGARSLANSGACSELTGTIVSPSGVRSLARSGAPTMLALAQPAGIRSLATAGACLPSVPTLAGCQSSAQLGACYSVAIALPTGARSRAATGAATGTVSTACSGSRSLAQSGAGIEVSGSVISPAGVRSLSNSGALTLTTAIAPTGVRCSVKAGPSVETSGSVVSPAGVRSLASSGACSIGGVAITLTGCKSVSISGAGLLSPIALPAGTRGATSSGTSAWVPSVAPAGARHGRATGAPVVVSLAAVSGSRLLAVSGASQVSTVYVVSPAGIRGLSRSGASVDVASSAVTTASGIRSAAVMGAGQELATTAFVTIDGIRSLAKSGVSSVSAAAPFNSVTVTVFAPWTTPTSRRTS